MNSTRRTESPQTSLSRCPEPWHPSVELPSPAASWLPAALLGARASLTGSGEERRFGAHVLFSSFAATLPSCGSGKVFMALVQCSVLPPRGAARSERRCLGWGQWRSPGLGEQGEPWLKFQGAGAGQPLDGDHRQPGLYLQHSPRGTRISCVGSPVRGRTPSAGTKGRAVCVQAQSSSGEWGAAGAAVLPAHPQRRRQLTCGWGGRSCGGRGRRARRSSLATS